MTSNPVPLRPVAAVTAVIPTHNRCELLARTLQSVLAQKDVELSVVVVDDGGSDGSAAAVAELGLPNVQVVRHETPKGVSAARNAGLAETATPWVAFVDDDDLWAPEKLSAQLRAIEETPDARWSAVAAVHMDAACHARRCHYPPAGGDVSALLARDQEIPGGGSGVLVATELAREVGGFDTAMSILADWDFYIRLAVRSRLAAVPRPLMGYYVHADSMFHNVPGIAREVGHLTAKYADGPVSLGEAFLATSLVELAARAGEPRYALRLLAEGLRRYGPRPVGREVWTMGRGFVARRRAVPDNRWHAETDGWLSAYATAVPVGR